MNITLKRILFLFILLLLLAACGDKDEKGENNTSKNDSIENEKNEDEDTTNQKPYYDIGETFELIGYYSDGPMDITVNDIWIDPAEDHIEYIEEINTEVEDGMRVAFIDMTVKSKSDDPIGFGDFIPLYTGTNNDVDFTYPKNDDYTDWEAIWDEALEPGEEINLVGAIILSDKYVEFESAFTFNGHEPQDGNQVLHVPQEERNSPLGTYDFDEPIYPIDYGKDGGVEIVFHEVDKVEEIDGVEKNKDTDEILAFDITVTNHTDQDQPFDQALPFAHPERIEKTTLTMMRLSTFYNEAGELVDIYNGPEAYLKPGEIRKGTIYASFDPDEIDQIMISFFPYTFLFISDFSLQLNYNVD